MSGISGKPHICSNTRRRTKIAYNARGLVDSKTEPDPNCGTNYPVTTYDYDDAGQLSSLTDPLSRTTSVTRDKVGRITRQTDPDPDGKGALAAPYTDYAYNDLGTVTSVTDPRGYTTSSEYDNLQRVTKITGADPDGAGGQSAPVQTYTYGSQNLLTKITNPMGHDTEFGYDAIGRRTTETNEDGKSTTTTYYAMGRVATITGIDPDGAGSLKAPVTSYTYDSNHKLVGGIGVSGDTSCSDHNIAWRTRRNLNLDHLSTVVPGVAGIFAGDAKIGRAHV